MFCLIRPPGADAFRMASLSLAPPLGAAYIAAAIEASRRPVHVIDAVTEAPRDHLAYFRGYLIGLPPEEIVRRIPEAADFVGITCIFTHEWPIVARLVELIKRERPELPVVVGGEHVTSMPEFCLATAPADFLVLGEGEDTIVELLDAVEAGKPLRDVAGIAFRQGDQIVVNPRRSRNQDVDSIPWPAWHHFDLECYHEHRFAPGIYSSSISVPMLATRGCPYQCTYCSAPNMWTPSWIVRDPVKVVDEIEHYVNHYGARDFPFQDLTAIVKKEWIVAFCKELLARDLQISWQLPSGTRSEAIDAEVAELLRKTGMVCMAYAPESGSETTRRYIKKRMTTKNLFASIRAAADADLNVAAFVIVGLPHDRPEHMRETLAFAREIARAGVTDIGTGYYMALPGTELFRNLYQNGKIRLDRNYFRHILEAQAPFPPASYCEAMGRLQLFYWRMRFSLAFYRTRLRHRGIAALWRGIRQTVSGGSHGSKLETMVRTTLKNGMAVLATRWGRRWMPVDEERHMFEGWDALYREIWNKRMRDGARETPADATQLHQHNVISSLRVEHDAVHTFASTRIGDEREPEAA